jgi:FtsZ-binding cell division protein ZapB
MSKRSFERQKPREEKLRLAAETRHIRKVDVKEFTKQKKKALPNRKSSHKTPEEEMAERQEMAERAATVYHQMLPSLLRKLKKIEDYRNPKKVKHKMTLLMAYGILHFVFQIGSRRNANREMTRPIMEENLRAMFPDMDSMPHADTLARLLEKIEVDQIQECLMDLIRDLLRKKKFQKYMVNKRYLVAVDGSQKFTMDYRLEEEALQRHVGGADGEIQYYAYVLESVLVLGNGITLPVATEVLENKDWIFGESKQDCESKAFYRLAPKLRKLFGKNVTLLADGMYACGPVIKKCLQYNWGFMITLKEGSLPDVWREANELMRLEPGDCFDAIWGERQQHYSWANNIEYEYGQGRRKSIYLNVVICHESWKEYHKHSTGETESKATRYAWISSSPLDKRNVFDRCTRMGRCRWRIENNFLVEKHQGYYFEHIYSYTWNAMKGYHYLMKIGHFMNVLAVNSEILTEYVNSNGICGFIAMLRITLCGALLDSERLRTVTEKKFMWRLKAA